MNKEVAAFGELACLSVKIQAPLWQVYELFCASVPHMSKGNNSNLYLRGQWWGLNEVYHAECPRQRAMSAAHRG